MYLAGCDRGYHTYCLHLGQLPDGDWFCPSCVQQAEEQRARRRANRRAPRVSAGGRRAQRGAAARGAVRRLTGQRRGRDWDSDEDDSEGVVEVQTDTDDEVVLVAERGNRQQQQQRRTEGEEFTDDDWEADGMGSEQELAGENTRRSRQRGRFLRDLNAAAPRHGTSGEERRAPEPPPRLAQLGARAIPIPEPLPQVGGGHELGTLRSKGRQEAIGHIVPGFI
jgi:hypothetical protein